MPPKIVIDSSVILKWIYKENEKYLEQSESVLKDIIEGKIQPFAPELAKYEVFNVLLKSKKLSYLEAKEAINFILNTPIGFVALAQELAYDTYQIGLDAGITYYDASFVALARAEGATLITDNPKHQAKIKEVKVVALKDY